LPGEEAQAKAMRNNGRRQGAPFTGFLQENPEKSAKKQFLGKSKGIS